MSGRFFQKRNRWEEALKETAEPTEVTNISLIKQNDLAEISDEYLRNWLSSTEFKAKKGEVLLVPNQSGNIARVLLGADSDDKAWTFASLPNKLPGGLYRTDATEADANVREDIDNTLLGWILGTYKYDHYKKPEPNDGKKGASKPCLVVNTKGDAETRAVAEAIFWGRDLITTPAEDMGPQDLAGEAAALAALHGASMTLLSGEELLHHNYPAVHTVGRASSRPPVLIDIRWAPPVVPMNTANTEEAAGGSGQENLPRVTLVGKGVAFDTGGLNIKSAQGMKLMKKDMGGAALVLALGHVIMSMKLRVQLRILVPAVENAISGSSFRPLDVLQTRSGITVENGNTDAEGRLILCDALYEGASENPDLLIDAATLTGAARTALGPDIQAVFCNDDDLWEQLREASQKEGDPMWRLPLHEPYRKMLDSKVANIASTGEAGQAGAITAALFLKEFVTSAPRWVHIDTMAYVSGGRVGPGRPEGGETQGLRALWRLLKERYPLKRAAADS